MKLIKSVMAVAAVMAVLPGADSLAADTRSYASGNTILSFGAESSFLKSFEGGLVSAEVINQPVGPGLTTKKSIGQPRYEDVSIQASFSSANTLLDWVSDTFDGQSIRKDGTLTVTDYNFNAVRSVEFFQALINEVSFPACDASAKDPAYMTLKIAPEYTRWKAGLKSKVQTPSKGTSKLWLPSNFRLEIAGLDCAKVSKVDAFTLKVPTVTDDVGDARDYLKEPAKIDFPNLKITVPLSHAQSFIDWHDKFVVQGNNAEENEKTGALIFLAPNGLDELARIRFFNVGIFRLNPAAKSGGTDAVAVATVELYVERMEIDFMDQFVK